jgi:heme exporter protein A
MFLTVLSAHDLSVSKRDRLLFDKVNFTVVQGELLYIRGPNGAGKTSLLRVLTGLVEADEGQVQFLGEDIQQIHDSYYSQLIYFGHNLGVNTSLSGVENLKFWCQLHQIDVAEQEIYRVLASLSLIGLEDLPVGNLSAGQQRRVALARFWLKSSAVLWILDEPFTALDAEGIALLRERLLQHLAQQGSVIMTSHQLLDIDYPTKELVLEYRI